MSSRPRLLDLFCGAGGCSVGYHRAGFDVVGVDIAPQPNYPFEFHQGDVLDWLAWGTDGVYSGAVDAIHASPPCQAYSTKTRDRDAHPDLVGPVRELLAATGLPYVIENVVGAPLRDPIMLCGSSFGLGVQRHRLFESNVHLMSMRCAHGQQPFKYRLYDHGKWYRSRIVHVFGDGGGKGREHWPEAMGIDWMTDAELAEAIPPAYTEFVGQQLLDYLQEEAA